MIQPADRAGALANIRVLELAQVVAGPYCGMLLGDLGADVIKVEQPGIGDVLRKTMGGVRDEGETSAFLGVNRNKRSVVADLRTTEGMEFFLGLVRSADVVTVSSRPGSAARLGVDYASLRAVNPRIVYGAISGFGPTGPWALRGGYDMIAQAMTGIMGLTGEFGGDPIKAGVPVSDICAGIYLALGIVAALHARELTGEGQEVTTSLFEAGLSLCVEEAMHYWDSGEVAHPQGSVHRFSAPYQSFPTSDGLVIIAANTDKLWKAMALALEQPEWIEDQRFLTNARRMANREALSAMIEEVTRKYQRDELLDLLLAAGVPCAPVFDLAEALDNEQAQARQMVLDVPNGSGPALRTVGFPFKLEGTPQRIRLAPPALGADTDDLVAETGHGQ